ncbi:MAG TPA: twin-arginine translocation signal domain-containing protein [Allosphingosinicella sp.]
MRAKHGISRRSFLGQVGGAASLLGAAGCTVSHDSDSVDIGSGPRRPGTGAGNPRWERERECTDGDSGSSADRPGAGRRCMPDASSRRRRH